MIEILHSFACGLAFVGGLVVGIVVCMMALAAARRDAIEDSKQVLVKLGENVICQQRIAAALEKANQVRPHPGEWPVPPIETRNAEDGTRK